MAGHDDPDFTSPLLQDQMLWKEELRCRSENTTREGWCPVVWDGILCWPSTIPGDTASAFCPFYIAGFDTQANATKHCMPNGQWYFREDLNTTWTNFTQCYRQPYATVLMDLSGDVQSDNTTMIAQFLPVVKTISKVGYTVSLSTLIVAFCILATIKKLRCPRNILHMHLFASFMTRAFMALMKDVVLVIGVGLASDVLVKDGETYWLGDDVESNWQCKAFTSLWQYFILANYSWILMEGLYLHNLVFLALFTDSNSSIAGYVVLGWGLPAIFVLPWVAMRAALDDTYCWTTNKNPFLFLIIRVPTMLSILINFVLFVNIVRVLLSKLKLTVSEETQRYKRWARSTLVLVPLFGVHYTVFLGMSYSIGVNKTVEIVWLFCDQFFASFQGFFVAVLYCFLNGEVRAEVTRAWRSRKWPRLRSGRWGQRPSTHSCSTCSCNATKLSRESKHPKWWTEPWICFCRNRDTHRSTHSMMLERAGVV
ncbi:parathyroid hormone/parathyroid hormone-related peptide receptor isoform X2 [Cephus cinctus]|uniref:Parathyroid hormone/parathyroid hormone-related peptide receptor isoform X2 n=1 Tax=Cephus cinctus TaxID=211228 RepID=A0AAJ7FP50_CEPCN|nr:parathyroid hormone/parathyroid hormone-related peptide receptor isoform X2 [Cephus cinctus]